MTEQERAELRKLAEAATQAKANGDTWMAVHPDTLIANAAEIAALKKWGEVVSRPDAPGGFVGDIWFGHPEKRTLGTHRWDGFTWHELAGETEAVSHLLAEARAEIAAMKEKVKRQAGILEWQRIDILLLLGAVMAMKPNSELERRCDDMLRRAAQEASE